jgi:hypothetical protein
MATAAQRRRLAVPRQVAFWLLAFVFTLTMVGTTLPTPLYIIYRARWHFSSGIVTVIFAVYAARVQAGMALFLAGTVVGGIAVGAVFLGSLATANSLAPAERRGQTVSTYFVLCYAGLTIPVVGVGVASGFIGDLSSVLALSILLAALCMVSLARIRDAGAHAALQT